MLEQLSGLAARRPVLELVEDVHWADPTTLELLDLVVERVRILPVLVVVTFRPEFAPRWTGHPHVTLLSLGRLVAPGAAIVERLAGGKTLPAEVLRQIVDRTDGVPLFIEELTKAVLESGLLREEKGGYALAGRLSPLAIPSTLHDSLMARLDRLAPVKEVAQVGAVIGREFSRELLAAVAPLPEGELDEALGRLTEAELVFGAASRRGRRTSSSTPWSRRRRTSRCSRAGGSSSTPVSRQCWRNASRDVAEAQPEVLARHCAEAGLVEKAIVYWHEAGQLRHPALGDGRRRRLT